MAIAAGTILSGFLSGILGGAVAVEYRARREKHRELRAWYNKTARLSGRIKTADPNPAVGASEAMETESYIRNTCAGVHSTMAQHLTDAPPEVDREIVEKCEKLVEACQTTKEEIDSQIGISKNMLSTLGEASRVAEELQSEVESEQKEVGWF